MKNTLVKNKEIFNHQASVTNRRFLNSVVSDNISLQGQVSEADGVFILSALKNDVPDWSLSRHYGQIHIGEQKFFWKIRIKSVTKMVTQLFSGEKLQNAELVISSQPFEAATSPHCQKELL